MFKTLIFISVIGIIVDILLSDSSFKKYINVITGIMLIIMLLGKIPDMKDVFKSNNIICEAEKLSAENINKTKEQALEQLKKNLTIKIKYILEENNISFSDVKVDITKDYKLNYITLYNCEERAKELIYEKLKIDKSLIHIEDN